MLLYNLHRPNNSWDLATWVVKECHVSLLHWSEVVACYMFRHYIEIPGIWKQRWFCTWICSDTCMQSLVKTKMRIENQKNIPSQGSGSVFAAKSSIENFISWPFSRRDSGSAFISQYWRPDDCAGGFEEADFEGASVDFLVDFEGF